MTANGYEISFAGNENVLELIVVTVVQLCDYAKNSEDSVLYMVEFYGM